MCECVCVHVRLTERERKKEREEERNYRCQSGCKRVYLLVRAIISVCLKVSVCGCDNECSDLSTSNQIMTCPYNTIFFNLM